MANARSGNTFYVDTAGELTNRSTNVVCVIVTATTANAIVNFQDAATDANKMNLRVATAGSTQVFHFEDNPVSFSGGVSINTITNAVVTLILDSKGN